MTLHSFPEIQGTVFKNGSATLLARVVGKDGSPITRGGLSTADYTIYGRNVADLVAGHDNVPVTVSDLIHDTLQTDDLWDEDTIGYNFRYTLDVSTHQAFATAGQTYRIVFRLTPTSGQVILVRFRLYAV